ncbi:MAG: hypothetical protein ACOYOA_11055 [Saprospiraceae bacterium]
MFTPIGGSVYTHWTTLSSPTLDEAIDEYEILAASRMENMMTAIFFAAHPTLTVVESRYYRGLCYLTCILDIGGTLSTERTTCGDKCCLRTRVYTNQSTHIDVENDGYSETEGECLGNEQPPCNENVVKITENCQHDCDPPFIAEIPADY